MQAVRKCVTTNLRVLVNRFCVQSPVAMTTIMQSFKISANISMMFTEEKVLSKRYKLASDAKFRNVECAFPYLEPLETVKLAKVNSGLTQTLINAWPGDVTKGDIGIAALPGREKEFREKLELTVDYAKALDCKMVHVMAGVKTESSDLEKMEQVFLENIKYAAERLQKENIMVVIEPINNRKSIPKYFLTDIHKAVEYIQKINHPNLKLQFDFFHIQIMDGNLTKNLQQYFPHIGHIQIAQVPDRGEPDSPGEINYKYIFKLLQTLKYNGNVGLEYVPKGNTVGGLSWISECNLKM